METFLYNPNLPTKKGAFKYPKKMDTIDKYFHPETDPLFNELVVGNPNIEPALIEDVILASKGNRVLENVEVRVIWVDYFQLLEKIMQIQSKYSNLYTIYGRRIKSGDEIEDIVQLTIKKLHRLFELAEEENLAYQWVDKIQYKVVKARTMLSPYIHANELSGENGLENLKEFLRKIRKRA